MQQQFVFHSLCLIFLIKRSAKADVRDAATKCERVTTKMCRGFSNGYNTTNFPNRFNHSSQIEAEGHLDQLLPLFHTRCSPVLAFFACTQYIPVCESTFGQQLLPCRSVCKQAKKGCNPVLAKFGYDWPHHLKCSQYPRNVCLSPKYPSMLKNKTQTKFEREMIRQRKMLKQITLQVTQDVTLERGSTNFNSLSYLIVGLHPFYPMKRSLLQFANPPRSCDRVISARLFLYFQYAHKASFMTSQQVPLFPRRVVAHRVLKSWTESETTSTKRYPDVYWNQKLLAFGSDALANPTSNGVLVNPTKRGFVALDVTSAVRDWRNGQPNYGLLIRATDENVEGRDFGFASNADENREKHAYIKVLCRWFAYT